MSEKRGRANPEDNVLCTLTDWKTTNIVKGRGVGGTMTSRWAIGADKYNWVLFKQQQTGMNPSRKYFPGFKLLFKFIDRDMALDIQQVILLVANAFKEKTEKDMVIDSSTSPEDLGKSLDVVYKVNFCRHDNVFGRIFRGETDEDVDEETEETEELVDEEV
ncbi:MAG: hypothetical protein CMB80_01130 [Flammeovirgaceae bacterium]|nr:hypothetical protein [Flammeovirgaceae bacterium]|tara:strand:- start:369 stop:851 length:483 start_codon:yes stop_codon:yes gene_type:complete